MPPGDQKARGPVGPQRKKDGQKASAITDRVRVPPYPPKRRVRPLAVAAMALGVVTLLGALFLWGQGPGWRLSRGGYSKAELRAIDAVIPLDYKGSQVAFVGVISELKYLSMDEDRSIPPDFIGGRWEIVLRDPRFLPEREGWPGLRQSPTISVNTLAKPDLQAGTRVVAYAEPGDLDNRLWGDVARLPESVR